LVELIADNEAKCYQTSLGMQGELWPIQYHHH